MTTTVEEHPGHHPEEPDRLREALRERLLDVGSMTTELKALVALSAVVLLFLAVLSLLRGHQLGTLVTNDLFSQTGQEPASMSQVLFVATVLILSLGWALVTTAAARSGWIVRIAVLVALGIAFGHERAFATAVGLTGTLTLAALCAAVAVIVVGSWWPERDVPHDRDPRQLNAGPRWRTLRRLVLPVSFLLFLAIYAVMWNRSNSAGVPDNFPAAVEDQLDHFQWFLIPILTLAGADFGDWGNFAGARVLRRVRVWADDRVTAAVAGVVAALIAADGLRIAHGDGSGIVTELVMAAIVVAVTAVLLVVARPRDRWPHTYPFALLAAATGIDAVIAFVIYQHVGTDPTGTRSDGYDALAWFGLAAIGVLVVALGRRVPTWATIGGMLAVLVGTVYTLTSLDSMASIVGGLGWTSDTAPYLGLEGLKAAAGIVTVAVVVVAAATGRVRAWIEPIAMLMSATVALQVLGWLISAYGGALSHGGKEAAHGALVAAAVLVVALSWELATSGESITNGHARRFTRDARVLSFLGYVLVTAVTSVFFSSIGTVKEGRWELEEAQFEAETYVRSGLLFVGVPLVLLILVLRLNRWRQTRAAEALESSVAMGAGPAPHRCAGGRARAGERRGRR